MKLRPASDGTGAQLGFGFEEPGARAGAGGDVVDRARRLRERFAPDLGTDADPAIPARPADSAAPEPQIEVRVVQSAKRRKSVSARMVNGVLELRVPSWMSKAEQDKWAAEMLRRFQRKQTSSSVDLAERCRVLCSRFDLEVPKSVRWVGNQNDRWGSCTPGDGTIRISNRLASMPTWVLDYVLVHELAHLRHPDHGKQFWATVNRYPRTERARGFLLGVSCAAATGGAPGQDDHSDNDIDADDS